MPTRYHALATQPQPKAQALGRAQRFIQTLGYAELRQRAIEGGLPAEEAEPQLQVLARSAGYRSIKELRGDECLLAHPYYWAPFFLVGDRLEGLH